MPSMLLATVCRTIPPSASKAFRESRTPTDYSGSPTSSKEPASADSIYGKLDARESKICKLKQLWMIKLNAFLDEHYVACQTARLTEMLKRPGDGLELASLLRR
jgi:hypothetical protein